MDIEALESEGDVVCKCRSTGDGGETRAPPEEGQLSVDPKGSEKDHAPIPTFRRGLPTGTVQGSTEHAIRGLSFAFGIY